MSTRFARTAAVLLIGFALSAPPALAQGRRDRGQGGQGQGQGRSAEPRGGGGRAERGNGGGRQEAGTRSGRADNGARSERADNGARDNGGGRRTERQPNIDRQPRADLQPRAEVQPQVQAQPGIESRQRFQSRSRSDNRSGWDGQYGDTNRRAVPRPAPYYGDRGYRDVRPRVVVPQYRYYGGSGYRSYPRHTYIVPYGYRPYGYGPGWNLNLYFGRPYGRQIYGNTGYGYYAIDPGFAYGSLRIVDAPRYAQVFVDGYYAGEVDDYDGIFQRLNLAPGPHRIEIVIDESAPAIEFDVQIIPGETVTYHARF